MPRLGVPSTTDRPLCARRTSPSPADELPENHRPGSTFARIFERPIDPRKGTKGRRIDGSELGGGVKKRFFFKLSRDVRWHIPSDGFTGSKLVPARSPRGESPALGLGRTACGGLGAQHMSLPFPQ